MNLLSICIPTYNRKDRLKTLLDYLCKLVSSDIDIIVIDNASTDGTLEMMTEFVEKYDVLYFRNKENLGHDGNYIRLIEEGKKNSHYSLWLGDDDWVDEKFFLKFPSY